MSRGQWLIAAGVALLLLLVPLSLCIGLAGDDPPPSRRAPADDAEEMETDEDEREDDALDEAHSAPDESGEAEGEAEDEAEDEAEAPPSGVRTLRGRVLDLGGKPIEGAEVSLKDLSGYDVSDDDGRYLLGAVPAHALGLVVRAPGYAESFLSVGDGEAGGEERYDVTLEDGDTAAGVVLDGRGRRLRGAEVRCVEPAGEPTGSDVYGRFELPEAAVGCTAIARHAGKESPRVVLEPGPHNVLSLAPPAGIGGVVVDGKDHAVTTFIIDIVSYRDEQGVERPRRYHQTFSHPGGRFSLSNLDAGRYVLKISTRQQEVQTPVIQVAAGETRSDVRVVLP